MLLLYLLCNQIKQIENILMKLTPLFRVVLLFVVVFLVAGFCGELMAQGGPPTTGSGPGGPPTGTPVPIDGGISALVVAGAAYGIKKLRDRNKQDKPAA